MNAQYSYKSNKRRKQVFIQKLVITVFACILTLGLSIVLSDDSVSARTEAADTEIALCKYYTSIEVSAGDSLWSIAEQYTDKNDETIHDYIADIKEINGMKTNKIRAGQYLTVYYLDLQKEDESR